MFLNIDFKDRNSVAAIDDSGTAITYGSLLSFSKDFYFAINKRTLIFILSENSIGSMVGYVASLVNKVVPLIVDCNIDREYFNFLVKNYKPEYLWLPKELACKFNFDIVFENYSFLLLKTGLKSKKLFSNLSLLLPTSGSTGAKKLVRHSYKNINENAKNVASIFNLKSNDKAAAFLPMHYTMGLSVVTSHLYAGATVLLTKRSLTDKYFWTFLKEENATSFTGVPFSFEILYKLRFFRMDLPYLKMISQGGGKLSEKLFNEFAEFAKQTNKQFIATYGQTEGTGRMAFLTSEKATQKTVSIGKAIPGGKLYLIDKNENIINEANKKGELVYEGPNVTMGYAFNSEDLNKGDLNKGVLKTGDIAIKDTDGYFYIVGRKNRFLKLYGIRINLDELQQMISSKFKTDCICTGNDDKMIVYITDKKVNEDVFSFIVDRLKLFHKAFDINVINNIPRNSNGKISYSALLN